MKKKRANNIQVKVKNLLSNGTAQDLLELVDEISVHVLDKTLSTKDANDLLRPLKKRMSEIIYKKRMEMKGIPVTSVQCESCKEIFFRAENEGWKKLCLECWKKSKTVARGKRVE